MSVEIIYEKKYPHFSLEEFQAQFSSEISEEREDSPRDYNELMKMLFDGTTYVLLPERIKSSEEFIKEAIEVSELYEFDTKIERHIDRICVRYSFDCGGGLKYINRILGMADQIAFDKNINNRDITILLDYFTHATIRNNRMVSP